MTKEFLEDIDVLFGRWFVMRVVKDILLICCVLSTLTKRIIRDTFKESAVVIRRYDAFTGAFIKRKPTAVEVAPIANVVLPLVHQAWSGTVISL